MSNSKKPMAQQKFKINMTKQTCNYCKGSDHRIHTMDTYGAYRLGWALMTEEEEAHCDACDEEEEDYWNSSTDEYYHASFVITSNKMEKEEYERNEWQWSPKGP